ncbi:MAG: ATP-binding protein [Oscillospiraceae bacterium]
MKKRNLTLRFKLTAIVVGVMTVMCLVLTAISFSASQLIVDAVPMTPAVTTGTPLEEFPDVATGTMAALTLNTQQAAISFKTITLGAMVLVIAVGALSSWAFIKKELQPLEELSLQVAALEVDNLSAPVRVHTTGDEIEQLSTAITQMLERVNDAYNMQKNFAANAAHELKTPLAAMQSKLEVFKMKPRTQAEYDGLFEVIQRNTQRLSSLVGELLELTNQAPMDMHRRIDLAAIAEEFAMDLEPLAREKGVSIAVEGQGDITGNEGLMQRALFNLMENAVKYNVEGGTVLVQIKKEGDRVLIKVSDTGLGIPQESKDKVFDLFFRVDKSRSREMGGNGLGLAIVQHIVHQHKGVITVRDNRPQGTVFEIAL